MLCTLANLSNCKANSYNFLRSFENNNLNNSAVSKRLLQYNNAEAMLMI